MIDSLGNYTGIALFLLLMTLVVFFTWNSNNAIILIGCMIILAIIIFSYGALNLKKS